MAATLKNVRNILQNVSTYSRCQIRSMKYYPRKIEPEEEKTHAQRIAEMKKQDPELDKEINIGFHVTKMDRTERRKTKKLLKDVKSEIEKRKELEEKARKKILIVPLDNMREVYLKEKWPYHWKTVAEHYGVYRDLFDSAMFYPTIHMDISYDFDEEYVSKVYMGNKLKPCEVKSKPEVQYSADPDTWWTLAMTAPDSHLQDNNMEYLHWLVGNIPGSDVGKGEELCNYLTPFPVKGTGYHRYIFVLYKQNKKIDFNKEKRPENCTSLKDRTFSTLEFYRKLQEEITPASLHMFQADWDESVRDTFWYTLDMKEPRFEFKHPPAYHPKQVWYPHKVPFNLYLDRYRDIKDINEEVLREKLKDKTPFKQPEKEKYPMLNLILYKKKGVQPSWLKTKLKHKYLEEMHWKDTDESNS